MVIMKSIRYFVDNLVILLFVFYIPLQAPRDQVFLLVLFTAMPLALRPGPSTQRALKYLLNELTLENVGATGVIKGKARTDQKEKGLERAQGTTFGGRD